MPPGGPKLSAANLAPIEAWINAGALKQPTRQAQVWRPTSNDKPRIIAAIFEVICEEVGRDKRVAAF